jgi:signal transduction histidine kinase
MASIARVLELGGRGERERMAVRVEQMAERLATEEHARARFIGKVSHELRTPLTVING